jgi:hypothetical protein
MFKKTLFDTRIKRKEWKLLLDLNARAFWWMNKLKLNSKLCGRYFDDAHFNEEKYEMIVEIHFDQKKEVVDEHEQMEKDMELQEKERKGK